MRFDLGIEFLSGCITPTQIPVCQDMTINVIIVRTL